MSVHPYPKRLTPQQLLIWDLEFKLYKAEHGLGMPYDAQDVAHYRRLLAAAKAADPDSDEVRLAAMLISTGKTT